MHAEQDQLFVARQFSVPGQVPEVQCALRVVDGPVVVGNVVPYVIQHVRTRRKIGEFFDGQFRNFFLHGAPLQKQM